MKTEKETKIVLTDEMKECLNNLSNVFSSYKETIESLKETLLPITRLLQDTLKNISEIGAFINRMKEAHFVCWELLPNDKLLTCLKKDNEIDFLQFYNDSLGQNNLDNLIGLTKKALANFEYKKLFEESIKAFDVQNFNLAVLGLTTVIDSCFDKMVKNNSYKLSSKIGTLKKKIEKADVLERDDINTFLLYSTFTSTIDDFTSSPKFENDEPLFLNRNWIVHGRKTLNATKIDCEKMIRILYSSFLINGIV